MNDTLKMYGSIGSDIMNRYFVVAHVFQTSTKMASIANDQFRRSTFKECVSLVKKRENVLVFHSP